MQYEPIKASLNSFFKVSWMRRLFYSLLDLLLLRSWHVIKALREISKEIPADSTILDAGSGLGQYVWRMAKKNKSWKITGIDISKDQIADCTRFVRSVGIADRVKFVEADLAVYQGFGDYDLILSVDVMEHILEDEKVFCNFFNSMKKGGILLISTPSDMGGSDAHDEDDSSYIEEHVRNGYSKMGITEKLTMAGFKDINVAYTYSTPGKISWYMAMKYPIALLNISKIFFIVLPIYYLFVFPFCLVLYVADLFGKHETGSGLLVTARKR